MLLRDKDKKALEFFIKYFYGCCAILQQQVSEAISFSSSPCRIALICSLAWCSLGLECNNYFTGIKCCSVTLLLLFRPTTLPSNQQLSIASHDSVFKLMERENRVFHSFIPLPLHAITQTLFCIPSENYLLFNWASNTLKRYVLLLLQFVMI